MVLARNISFGLIVCASVLAKLLTLTQIQSRLSAAIQITMLKLSILNEKSLIVTAIKDSNIYPISVKNMEKRNEDSQHRL
jgi:hypothetical protein